MKIKICIAAMLLLCACGRLQGQTTSFVQPLTIGDTLPDIIFTNLYNHPTKTIRVADFKSKLLILDFWASWCTNCLHSFPLLDSMQRHLRDSMQVILVNSKATTDDVQRIVSLFANLKKAGKGKFILPSVIYDSVLDKLFPHTSLPHYVWLYNNKVAAITGSKEVTAANIHLALKNNLPALSIKNDAADTVTSIYAKEEAGKIIYGSAFTRFDSIKSRKQGVIETASNKTFYFINTPVINLYENALQRSLADNFLLHVTDSAKYFLGDADWDEWGRTNTYCYELTVPKAASAPEISAIMLQDLNRYLGLNGRFEEQNNPPPDKPHKVFVLSEKKCWIDD